MTEVTWKILAKEVDDKKTIEEEIDEDVKTHTEDPSAHGQTNEAIATHRVAEILDHLDESVRNAKLWVRGRAFTAVVDPAGEGDYTDIQDAINSVNGLGGGSILILPGTYTLSADLTLYSNISLIGFDKDTTIIDFNDAAYQVLIVGTDPTHKKHIVIKSLTIKNSTLDFATQKGLLRFSYTDDVLIFDSIFENCDGALIYIEQSNDIFIDRCSLTNGLPPGFEYGIYDSASRIFVTNCTFTTCFYAIKGLRGIATGNIITGCDTGIETGSYFSIIDSNRITECDDPAITSQGQSVISNNYCKHCGDATKGQIWVSTSANNVVISGNTLEDSIGAGIYVAHTAGTGTGRITITGNTIFTAYSYTTSGIKIVGLDADHLIFSVVVTGNHLDGYSQSVDGIYFSFTHNSVISGNRVNLFTGYGVKILEAASDKNIINGNQLTGNTTGAISDSGTDTEIGHNTE